MLEKQLLDLEDQKNKKYVKGKSVTSSEIASVISKTTGIPLERMLESEKDKLLGMNLNLKMVIGQNDATEKI